jgi:uncharacterized protein (TIGR03118 family)
MKANFGMRVSLATLIAALVATMDAAPVAAHGDGGGFTVYSVHNLVSDGTVTADNPSGPDANLVNPWGIVFNPWGPVWISDNGTGVSTLYDGAGHIVPLVVAIPPPAGGDSAAPTGIVFNGAALLPPPAGTPPTSFVVTDSATKASGVSLFMFATEQGTIAGWAPSVDFTHAFTAVDNSASGAVYKGLALSAGGNGNLLYATDFHNRRIDVFDSAFKPATITGKFDDPNIPADFAPFGIQAINGDIYVTYAKQDADKHDDVHGRGLGYVDAFDPNGNLLQRVAIRGFLNAPWGLTVAPAGFGSFAGRLLVGNFGDGHVNAFDLATGRWVGMLIGNDRRPLEIEGLWGLAFGNGFLGQQIDSLYFTAGPKDESEGVYGVISPTTPSKGMGHDG